MKNAKRPPTLCINAIAADLVAGQRKDETLVGCHCSARAKISAGTLRLIDAMAVKSSRTADLRGGTSGAVGTLAASVRHIGRRAELADRAVRLVAAGARTV